MSADISPHQPLPPPYMMQPQPRMPITPVTATSTQMPDSSSISFAESNGSFSSGHQTDHSPSQTPGSGSGKGKNGATGPADGKMKPHLCHVCQRGFTTGGHLQRHQRIHTGVKAFKCPYAGCETRTSRQDNLQQHYRTHLSPTLRRGSGSEARAAVAQAMEQAGLKSTSTRGARKKGSQSHNSHTGTSSSNGSINPSHIPSAYSTPITAGPSPYGHYNGVYNPSPYGYPTQHSLPPHHMMTHTQPQSAASSRVPSPANGNSSGHSSVASIPNHQQPPHFPQPFPQPYPYPNQVHPNYRYSHPPPPPPQMQYQPHYAQSHHALYSPGLGPDHNGQLYSPLQPSFPTHSRESSYGVITPGYPNPGSNGYPPPRTQTSTPLSQIGGQDDMDSRYRRQPSPVNGDSRRRTPPHDMISQGVVDPNSMVRPQQGMMHHNYGGGFAPPHHVGGYGYGHAPTMGMGGLHVTHRASISSMSDGSVGGESETSGKDSLRDEYITA